jgi:hypothetical protein
VVPYVLDQLTGFDRKRPGTYGRSYVGLDNSDVSCRDSPMMTLHESRSWAVHKMGYDWKRALFSEFERHPVSVD